MPETPQQQPFEDPRHDLAEEHGAIETMLLIMERIDAHAGSGNSLDRDHLRMVMAFLEAYADHCHHRKEEDVVFPALKKTSHDHDTLIDELLAEHAEGRRLLEHMRALLDTDQQSFLATAKAYSALLFAHIKKENLSLLPLLAQFSSKDQTTMEQGFQEIEHTVLGTNGHDEFRQMIATLNKAFPRARQ